MEVKISKGDCRNLAWRSSSPPMVYVMSCLLVWDEAVGCLLLFSSGWNRDKSSCDSSSTLPFSPEVLPVSTSFTQEMLRAGLCAEDASNAQPFRHVSHVWEPTHISR